MARFFKAAVFATLALSLADAAVAQNGRLGPPVLTPEQILRRPMVFTTYKWTHSAQGDAPVKGPLTATHICVLTQLTGKFQGAGERIAVYIDAGATGGPRWVISGSSGQGELAGDMTCAARDQFVFGPGLFSTFLAKSYANHSTGSCAPHIVSMGLPDKNNAFFISGISGKFEGGGESVSVISQGGQGAIRVTGCSGSADGTLSSIGNLNGKPLLYRTPSGRAPLGSPGVNFVLDDAGPESHWFSGADLKVGGRGTALVPVNEALCGLVEVRGKFQGFGEAVGVGLGKGFWGLYVAENGEDAVLHGTARCIARDQRSG